MTTWDSNKIDHPDHPVIIHLEKYDEVSFKIWVIAPLYSEVEHPPGLPGEPFFGLWDYEGNVYDAARFFSLMAVSFTSGESFPAKRQQPIRCHRVKPVRST